MQNDLEILKETKYLSFIVKEHKPKTKVVAVVNKTHKDEIGVIRWYSGWRQYCFFPHPNTIWNTACLDDVNNMITELTPVKSKPRIKNIAVIAQNIQNFQEWRIMKKHTPSKKLGAKNTQREYKYKNNKYICITKPNHVCGYSFDKVIETERAYLNKDIQEIMKSIHLYANVKKKS